MPLHLRGPFWLVGFWQEVLPYVVVIVFHLSDLLSRLPLSPLQLKYLLVDKFMRDPFPHLISHQVIILLNLVPLVLSLLSADVL